MSRWQGRAAAGAVLGAAAACTAALDWAAPFRFGLFSVLLYAAPWTVPVLAARRLRAAGMARDVRPVLAGAAAVLAGLVVLAVPLGFLQRAAAPAVWIAGSGIPSRAWAQVIVIPGMTQEQPYLGDARAGRLTAYFDVPAGPGQFWAAVETVRSGTADPCATLDYPDGDGASPEAARCTRAGPGLWMLLTRDGTGAGFARRAGGVTITLAGSSRDRPGLRRAILGAHPGSDTELWSRIDSVPARATLIFL